jgi:CBS domain-containing protein
MTTVHASRDLRSPGRLNRRPVVEVMTVPAPVISDNVPLAEAVADMVRLDVRHAAVIDRRGRCIGVLCDRVAVSRWAADRSPRPLQTVASALPAIPAIIAANTVVLQAARLMRSVGVDALAVVDPQGRPVGVVTDSDLIALLSEGE